jgi:predicted dehydrogenase
VTPVRILILGTGDMAKEHAKAFGAMADVEVVGGVDIDPARLAAFTALHKIPHAFPDLEAALAWGAFDAAANVTPDSQHHPTTMRLIAAGKHVFCEKPLATIHGDAVAMADALEAAGLVGMVNLTYRGTPELQKTRALIAEGVVGRIRHVEASYRQSWLVGRHWGDWRTESRWLWRLSEEHGSLGVLGDVGIHILDFLTFATGSTPTAMQARLVTYPKAPGDRIGAYRLDANDGMILSLAFDDGSIGMVQASRTMTGYANRIELRVFGDRGAIEAYHEYPQGAVRVCAGADVDTLTWRPVACPPARPNYDAFIRSVRAGRAEEPGFRRAADLQRILDDARRLATTGDPIGG